LRDDLALDIIQQKEIERFFNSYITGMPLDYILNETSFLDFKFYVDERVLIPRPATEVLVSKILDLDLHPSANILEVGVGSGCISISLSLLRTDLKIIASDISLPALKVAHINMLNYKTKNIQLVYADWLSYATPSSLDLVISNPPYIHPNDPHLLGLTHEPITALISPDGNESFVHIAEQAFIALKDGGMIIFEHGYNQKDEVIKILSDAGFSQVHSLQDLQELDRIVFATK